MARLRYNGLSTTLGGSLTNVATSVTFAAALTHSNGTNVPTIVAPDYIPLAILGATGHLSEIVYLTAYTAAGTTGTITRGVEGTTGAAHSSGDVVTQAQLVGDHTGEGGGDFFLSGFYAQGHEGTAAGTLAMTLNQLCITPFIVPARRSFDRIGIDVTAGGTAGAVLRMGIYSPGPGAPGPLLVDAGTVASTSTGGKEITISQTLDPGTYWLATVAQTAVCTVRTLTATSGVRTIAQYTAPLTTGGVAGGSMSSVSGALPTTYVRGGNQTIPLIGLRAL